MALINCPECKKEVSDQSISCPNCGYPIKQKTIFSPPPPLPRNQTTENKKTKKEETPSPFVVVISIFVLIFIIAQCSSDDSSSSASEESKITSSGAVGGDADTMQECKHKLDQTAKKYNVTYTVTMDERDYFSGKIVKDGVQTDLLVVCDKKDDYYTAMFEVPN